MAFYCNGKQAVCDCTILCNDCSFFDNSGGKHILNNADRIRAMSDEELAQWLCLHYGCTKCPGDELCTINDGKHNGLTKWLQQPAEEGQCE